MDQHVLDHMNNNHYTEYTNNHKKHLALLDEKSKGENWMIWSRGRGHEIIATGTRYNNLWQWRAATQALGQNRLDIRKNREESVINKLLYFSIALVAFLTRENTLVPFS